MGTVFFGLWPCHQIAQNDDQPRDFEVVYFTIHPSAENVGLKVDLTIYNENWP